VSQLDEEPPRLVNLFVRLEQSGEACLERAEADSVKTGGIDVVAGDAANGPAAQLDGPVDSPIRMCGVVDGNEDLAIHRHLPLWAGRVCERRDRLSSKRGHQLPAR